MTATAGVPRVDPLAPQGLFRKAYASFLRTAAGRWIAINGAARVDPTLMKLSRGYVGIGVTFPTVNVTTKGAKSGKDRVATVLYFTEDDDVVLIASSFGRDKDPAWSHNLKANPSATLDSRGRGGRYSAAEITDEVERARLWKLADMVYPGYADYRVRTAKTGRTIPMFRLSPV